MGAMPYTVTPVLPPVLVASFLRAYSVSRLTLCANPSKIASTVRQPPTTDLRHSPFFLLFLLRPRHNQDPNSKTSLTPSFRSSA